jgi:hypothetical protein
MDRKSRTMGKAAGEIGFEQRVQFPHCPQHYSFFRHPKKAGAAYGTAEMDSNDVLSGSIRVCGRPRLTSSVKN